MHDEVEVAALESKRRLLFHGVLLFLLGLLTGLISAQLANPRMGLSAHLEGVINGILLMAIGAFWLEVRLSHPARRWAFYLLLFGTYANWAVTLLAASWGTGAMTPIAGKNLQAAAWQEGVVTIGFICVALSMIAVCVLLLLGLTRRRDA